MLKTFSIIDLANLFLERLGITPGGSVVEFGCGKGGMIGRLQIAERMGVDIWEPFLEVAAADFPLVEFVQHDLLRIEELLRPNSFDVVVGFDILEHFTLAEAQQVMAAAERIARKGILWWGPLEPKIRVFDAKALEGNPAMQHKRVIDPSEFDGWELMCFPDYWPPETDPGASGFLALQDLRGTKDLT